MSLNLLFLDYKTALQTEITTAEIYHEYCEEDYKLSKRFLYKFDKVTKLWIETTEDHIIFDISKWLLNQQIRFTKELNEKLILNPRDTQDIFKQISEITKESKKITGYSHLYKVYKFLTKLINDETFIENLNHMNPLLLPIKNSLVVDLRTSITSERTKDHFFSYECPVEITTKKTDFFKNFLNSIMLDDVENIHYLQRILGYTLSGSLKARSFFIFFGNGKNGKSIIMLLMKAVLNSSYKQIMKEVFIQTNKSSHVETMEVKGARMCVLNELNCDEKLNESFIKSLTGGDPISARPLYKDVVTFNPICKIFICSNNKPCFDANDTANVDRVKLIPFNARFVQNPTKPNERQCILNIDKILIDDHIDEWFTWLLVGAKNYFNDNLLNPPSAIKEAENQYIAEQSSFKSWVSEYIIESDKSRLNRASAFVHYEKYCIENSIKTEKKKKFFSLMLENYICLKSHGEECYKYIDIKKTEEVETNFNDLDI